MQPSSPGSRTKTLPARIEASPGRLRPARACRSRSVALVAAARRTGRCGPPFAARARGPPVPNRGASPGSRPATRPPAAAAAVSVSAGRDHLLPVGFARLCTVATRVSGHAPHRGGGPGRAPYGACTNCSSLIRMLALVSASVSKSGSSRPSRPVRRMSWTGRSLPSLRSTSRFHGSSSSRGEIG